MRKNLLTRYLKLFLIFYGLTGLLIYFLQERIFFQSEALPVSHVYHFALPHEEIFLPFRSDATIHIVRFRHTSVRRGLVLYLHGNKRNISRYGEYAGLFTKNGYEVWMVDYPGFGKSTGLLTEKNLYAYALQMYKRAAKEYAPDSIIIYGKSLGTGIAAWLGAQVPAQRVMLETPYYSLPSIGASFMPIYPWHAMLHFQIPTYEYIEGIEEPVTIFHGTGDMVIPYRNALRLEPYLSAKDEFVSIRGGSHNDLQDYDLYRRKLDSLLLFGLTHLE